MKNIIIFGSSGNLGFKIKDFLLKKKFNVYYPNRKDCDLTDLSNTLNYFEKLENKKYTIIFCASDTKNKNKISCLKNNLKIINNFISAKNLIDIENLIYFSSIVIFNNEYLSGKKNVTKFLPQCFYEVSKYYSEKMIIDNFAKKKVTILRLPGVYGKNKKSLINYLFNSIKNNKSFYMYNNGQNRRSYLYDNDLNKIIFKIINFPQNRIINLTNNENYKILEIIKFLEKVLSKKAKYNVKKSNEDFNIVLKSNINNYFKNFKFTSYKAGIKNLIKLND